MERKETTYALTTWGLFNIMSPLPLLLLTSFWGLLILVGSGFRSESPLPLLFTLLPAFIHPISSIAAFICAIRRRKHTKRDSIRCAVLTAIGAAENMLLWIFLAYRSSVG